jgi:Holliday junction resolvase
MKLIEQIVEVFAEHRGTMHVDEVAKAIIVRYPNIQFTPDVLAAKVTSVLAADVKKRKGASLFSKPKNKTGGFRKGMYRLKVGRKSVSKAFKVPEQPRVSSQYTGKAGEYAVMSELLFFGFNASVMTVDDGIDIVANKEDTYFHIQVKTANVSLQSKYQFKVTKRAFGSKDAASTFYVLVMRVNDDTRNISEYLVLPSSEIRRLVDTGVIKDGESISISIERERGSRFLLNGVQEVSWALNRFDNIK